MDGNADESGEKLVNGVIAAQLAHFRYADPPCRGLQLPDGVLLHHTQSETLYFYLKTVVENGAIQTQVYASDSPYDHLKSGIGAVSTPMFESAADYVHLKKIEQLLRGWVQFVKQEPEGDGDFQSFNLSGPPQ